MVFSNVWPLSSATVSSSSSSRNNRERGNGTGVPAVSLTFAATSSSNVSTTHAPMPVPVLPVLPTPFHHHAEPASVPVVANMHPAMAPEALLDAVNEGSAAQVHAILARDPSLANHRDGFGQTPLMWAAYKGRVEMVSCLLDCGARIDECETRRARTALYLACEFDHAPVVAMLLARGANPTLAAQRGWTVLSRGYDGWTPLIIAGYNGCPAVLRCLLAPSSSSSHPSSHPLLEGRDERGATALWWAAVHNRPEAVRVLLEAGADFLQANDEDKTALDMARERSNTDCAMLLENAERIYLMCRARKVQRETQAWVSVLEEAMMGMPAWLAGRVRAGRDKLPLALAQPQLDREIAETQDGKQDGKEGGSGQGRLLEITTPISSFTDARQDEHNEEEEEEQTEERRRREDKILREYVSSSSSSSSSSSFSSSSFFSSSFGTSSLTTLFPPYLHSSSSYPSSGLAPSSTYLPYHDHHQPLEETAIKEEDEAGKGGRETVLEPLAVAQYIKSEMCYDIFLAMQDLLI